MIVLVFLGVLIIFGVFAWKLGSHDEKIRDVEVKLKRLMDEQGKSKA